MLFNLKIFFSCIKGKYYTDHLAFRKLLLSTILYRDNFKKNLSGLHCPGVIKEWLIGLIDSIQDSFGFKLRTVHSLDETVNKLGVQLLLL